MPENATVQNLLRARELNYPRNPIFSESSVFVFRIYLDLNLHD